MVFPPIHWFQGLKGRRRVSDVEFLAKKEFDGKLRTTEGTLSATGDLATITANSGKDMYLAKAKVSIRLEGATNTTVVIVELKANAVIKATWSGSLQRETTATFIGDTGSIGYEFVMSGIKVAATQIIKLEAVTVGASVEVNGELVVFEETTGADPTI